MRAAVAAALALAGCEVDRPQERPPAPSSTAVAAQIEAVFEKTCVVPDPSVGAIDAAVQKAGVHRVDKFAGGLVFYTMREIHDGVRTSVLLESHDSVLQCSVSSSDGDKPIDVIGVLAASIRNRGVMAAEPLALGAGYSDCRTYHVEEALRSACIFDFTPHGAAANLILTVPPVQIATS